jgi:hypothetical protein
LPEQSSLYETVRVPVKGKRVANRRAGVVYKITEKDRKKIVRLRKKLKLKEIGDLYNISGERVRQIVLEDCPSLLRQKTIMKKLRLVCSICGNKRICRICDARQGNYCVKCYPVSQKRNFLLISRKKYEDILKAKKDSRNLYKGGLKKNVAKNFFPHTKYPSQRIYNFITKYEKYRAAYNVGKNV